MTEPDDARHDYLMLRDTACSAQLATLTEDELPEASYAPCVWYSGDCYLYLSELSSHTGNLVRNPRIGLMLIEDATEASNPFARKRASLKGEALIIARDNDLFSPVMAEFHRRFGNVMKVIEPLPDFRLFRVKVNAGSFVRGFGQAFKLIGDKLDQLVPIDPRNQAGSQ